MPKPFSVFNFQFSILLVLVLAGCGREGQTDPATAEIPIGVFAALTGSEAAFGTPTVNGVRFAAEEINAAGGVLGRKIRLVIEDTQGRGDQAATVVTKLITSDNVVALIGENSSNQSLAAAPIAQTNEVPMVSPSSTNPAVTQRGEFIFRVCFTDPYQGKALAGFVRDTLKAGSVAMLVDRKSDYSVGLAEFFAREFTARGGRIAGQQNYTGGDSEFRPQLTAIRAMRPDVLFIPGFYTEAGQIAIQARDLGIKVPLVGGDGWDSPTVIEIGGQSVENSYFSDHYFPGDDRPLVQRFVAQMRQRHGKSPEANAALGYDALKIIVAAIERAGELDRHAIRAQIAATRDYDGVSGTITMGPDRDPVKPVAMIKIEGGQMRFVGWVKP